MNKIQWPNAHNLLCNLIRQDKFYTFLVFFFPNLDAQHIYDIVKGVTNVDRTGRSIVTILPKQDEQKLMKSGVSNHIFSTLGQLHTAKNQTNVNDALNKVVEVVNSLTEKDVHDIIKSQHPKLVLHTLNQNSDLGINLRWTKHIRGDEEVQEHQKFTRKEVFKVTGTIGSDTSSIGIDEDLITAENIAVKKLLEILKDDVSSLDVNSLEFCLEEDVPLSCVYDTIRHVVIKKEPDAPLGLFLKGGEVMETKDRHWQRREIRNPVYIAGFQNDEINGLRVGDELIAINEHRLGNLTLAEVIQKIASASDQSEINLAVRYDENLIPNTMARSRIEHENQNRVKKQLLGSEKWKVLHLAKARQVPDEYATCSIQHDMKKNWAKKWKPRRRNCIWRPKGLSVSGIKYK